MRLPPRQSTAEADLMVPFQLVSVSLENGRAYKMHCCVLINFNCDLLSSVTQGCLPA